jgi:PIN domain nuclease of toxin-antitoxin system
LVRLLLDTHVVLWQLAGSARLGQSAQAAIEQADELAFSVVSFVEIGVKASIGKLVVPPELRDHVVGSGLRVLGLTPEHALAVTELPLHHRDPFDRLLISQARAERMSILTADARFADYAVLVLDASA